VVNSLFVNGALSTLCAGLIVVVVCSLDARDRRIRLSLGCENFCSSQSSAHLHPSNASCASRPGVSIETKGQPHLTRSC